MFSNAIMTGEVTHRRLLPRKHHFTYPIAMVMLDLDTLEQTFKQSRWWSLERFNLISLYRQDYLQGEETSLKSTVKRYIQQQYGEIFEGQVFMLTHPRYFGRVFNPVTFYFCVDKAANQIRFILAEIINTPWNERHCYVLKANLKPGEVFTSEFDKAFHVSPFMPMDMRYRWQFDWQHQQLRILMKLEQQGEQQFIAHMQLRTQPLTRKTMRQLPKRFPLQTLQVLWRIYWQAWRLWLKKIPFYDHPNSKETIKKHDSESEI